VLQGVQATQQKPTTAPSGIANDPVAAYLAQTPADSSTTTPDISNVAKSVRASLDAQASAAAAAGKELVYDPGRKTGQLADLSGIDNRSLSAISLNQDGLFSKQESYAAKQELDSRNRASILAALKQSQTSGDPTQLSLGILNTYSAMSDGRAHGDELDTGVSRQRRGQLQIDQQYSVDAAKLVISARNFVS